MITAVYFLKLVYKGETYDQIKGSRVLDGVIATLALIYSSWVIISGTADAKTFTLGIGLFFLGFVVYPVFNKYSDRKAESSNHVR